MQVRSKWFVVVGITCFVTSISTAYSCDNTRNQRYCEIILSKSKMHLQVLNTWGLNKCPDSNWSKLSESHLKRETGSFFAHMRGPQYFVMDAIDQGDIANSETRTLGGLPLRSIALVEVHPADIIHGTSPYHEHQIHRNITYTYSAQQPVFELIDPRGRVFVMQSYSIQKTHQTLSGLSSLNTRLRLPSNWRFKTGLLNSTQKLASGSKATVLHDDYLNTYQLAPYDFLGPT